MNINIPVENNKIQNPKLELKSKTKFEKIKEILNNPVAKFCGSFTLFGATGFLIYYLCNKNKLKDNVAHKEYKERMVNGIKISVAVREWISKNIFLCAWKNGSCWNDTFTQLLMSPEIRCKECKSSKINKLFNWINDNLNEPYNGDYLERKIGIDDDIRVLPDNFEKSIDIPVKPIHTSELLLENFKFDNINFNDLNILNLIDDSYTGDELEENLKKSINNKENFYIDLNKEDKEVIYSLYSNYDYYPTFVVTNNKNNSHAYGYYIIYDKYKNIKYLLCVDGIKDNIEVLTKNEGFKRLKNCGMTSVKYSHWDTVKKYYVICT